MLKRIESFNDDISKWNVSNVTSMKGMFKEAKSFNQNIGNWDVSNVIDMSEMFYNNESFNKYIGSWDTSKLIYARYMFMYAKSFFETKIFFENRSAREVQGEKTNRIFSKRKQIHIDRRSE